MKLWLISQEVNNDYDTFDAAVVAAKNKDLAQQTHPSEWGGVEEWAIPEAVKVKLIGTAVKDTKAGVILASFNAG